MPALPFVIVTGLPASGKSTIGAALAHALNLDFIDKDVILEQLFEAHTRFNGELRQRLSRESDVMFREAAEKSRGAVLVSFWRYPSDPGQSGTPSDWLRALSDDLVEVHCDCPAHIAEARFGARVRHPGHLDALRADGLAAQFAALAGRGPLNIGRLVTIDTEPEPDIDALASHVRALLQ